MYRFCPLSPSLFFVVDLLLPPSPSYLDIRYATDLLRRRRRLPCPVLSSCVVLFRTLEPNRIALPPILPYLLVPSTYLPRTRVRPSSLTYVHFLWFAGLTIFHFRQVYTYLLWIRVEEGKDSDFIEKAIRILATPLPSTLYPLPPTYIRVCLDCDLF